MERKTLLYLAVLVAGFLAILPAASACHSDGCSGSGLGDVKITSEPDLTYNYGESKDFTIQCDASGSHECPDAARVEMCGKKVSMQSFRTGGNSYEYRLFGINVPGDFPCGLGTHNNFNYYGSGGSYKMTHGGSITVNAKGMSNPNKGKYIYTEFTSGENRVNAFFLSNDPWDDCVDSNGGEKETCGEFPDMHYPSEPGHFEHITVSEEDRGADELANPDDNTAFYVKNPGIIEPEDDSLDSTASEISGDKVAYWDGKEKGETQDLLGKSFSTGVDRTYRNGCKIATSFTANSCSPLHQPDGHYVPDAEIFNGFQLYDPNNNDTSSWFMVCRGSMDGAVAMGEYPRNAYEDLDDAYRCDTSSGGGDWEQVSCPKGFSFGYESGSWQCVPNRCGVNVNCPTTEVFKLDIKNVTFPSKNGYHAGFMVPSGTLRSFENVFGTQVSKVHADCWWGEAGNPPSSSDRVKFTKSVSGTSNDVWVVQKLPVPSTIPPSPLDYTCIFGFQDTSGDVYQGTGSVPFDVQISTMTVGESELASKSLGSTQSYSPFAAFLEISEDPVGSGSDAHGDSYCVDYSSECPIYPTSTYP